MESEHLMPIIFPAPIDVETSDILLGSNAEFFKINRELTHSYISDNPTQVVLTPCLQTVTTSGGRQWSSGVPRASQTVRLIEFTTVVGYGGTRASEGYVHAHRWIMLMEWDAVADRLDTFIYDGVEWQIVDFEPKNGYEIRAVVDRRG
jgi:hypothetical protein